MRYTLPTNLPPHAIIPTLRPRSPFALHCQIPVVCRNTDPALPPPSCTELRPYASPTFPLPHAVPEVSPLVQQQVQPVPAQREGVVLQRRGPEVGVHHVAGRAVQVRHPRRELGRVGQRGGQEDLGRGRGCGRGGEGVG